MSTLGCHWKDFGAGNLETRAQPVLSLRFPRPEYQGGLPFPSSGHLPHSGTDGEELKDWTQVSCIYDKLFIISATTHQAVTLKKKSKVSKQTTNIVIISWMCHWPFSVAKLRILTFFLHIPF